MQLLIDSCLKDLFYNNHPVISVHVPCTSSTVNIGEKLYENDYIDEDEPELVQRIMEDKKMDKRKLRETYPGIYGSASQRSLQGAFFLIVSRTKKTQDITVHCLIF